MPKYHSLVEFEGRQQWIPDGALVVMVESLKRNVDRLVERRCAEWLLALCERWLEYFEVMPSGLKALEFGDYLRGARDVECLVAAVTVVRETAKADGCEVLLKVCEQWMSVIRPVAREEPGRE